jgi:hypothetical protein
MLYACFGMCIGLCSLQGTQAGSAMLIKAPNKMSEPLDSTGYARKVKDSDGKDFWKGEYMAADPATGQALSICKSEGIGNGSPCPQAMRRRSPGCALDQLRIGQVVVLALAWPTRRSHCPPSHLQCSSWTARGQWSQTQGRALPVPSLLR